MHPKLGSHLRKERAENYHVKPYIPGFDANLSLNSPTIADYRVALLAALTVTTIPVSTALVMAAPCKGRTHDDIKDHNPPMVAMRGIISGLLMNIPPSLPYYSSQGKVLLLT